jgi:hypothetical protein
MGDSAALRLLVDVRDLVDQGWTQGADARDLGGRAVDPWDPAATSWSILGALVAVLEREAATTGELPIEQVAAALYAIADVVHVDSLEEWNDAHAQSREDVLCTIDGAIRAYACARPQARAS